MMPAVRGGRLRPRRRWAGPPALASEKRPKQVIRPPGLYELPGAPVLGCPLDRTIRVRLEGFAAPGGPEIGFPKQPEKRRTELPAEDHAAGGEKLLAG